VPVYGYSIFLALFMVIAFTTAVLPILYDNVRSENRRVTKIAYIRL